MQDLPFRNTALPTEDRVINLISYLTLEEKFHMLTTTLPAIPRLGIQECFIGAEIARGLLMRQADNFSTVLPQPYGLAATFDINLMHQLGEMVSDEVRICQRQGKSDTSLFVYGPTVDLERDPRWGRNEEGYGEDPCLASQIAASYVDGLSGNYPLLWKTVPVLKHFYANNCETHRRTASSNITLRLKHEYYLKPFQHIIQKGRALGIMTAYNSVNGMPCINNPEVHDLCKEQWGLIFAISDGGDFNQNVSEHRIFKTHSESLSSILGKGADLMLESDAMVSKAAKKAYDNGLITEQQLDNAIFSVFLPRFLTGEFDPPENIEYNQIPEDKLNCWEHKQLAEQAAKESIILLKNENFLPWKMESIKTVAIIGPNSNDIHACWYCGQSENTISLADSFQNILGHEKVLTDEGFDLVAIRSVQNGKYLCIDKNGNLSASSEQPNKSAAFEFMDWDNNICTLRSAKTHKYLASNQQSPISAAISCSSERVYGWLVKEKFKIQNYGAHSRIFTYNNQALAVDDDNRVVCIDSPVPHNNGLFEIEVLSKGCDRISNLASKVSHVIAALGSHPMLAAREEEDRNTLLLPSSQSKMLAAAAQANPKTLLYLVSSYPYAIDREEKLVDAVLYSTHMGPFQGKAASDVILGRYNPAGRCPGTWYHYATPLPDIMDYDISQNKMTYLYHEDDVLYPFGHGLSYTHFSYRTLHISQEKNALNIHVTLKNDGVYSGDEVVQIYIKTPDSGFRQPLKQLKAFKRVNLKAGQELETMLQIPLNDLSYFHPYLKRMVIQSGYYTIEVGQSSKNIVLTSTVQVQVPEQEKCMNPDVNALALIQYHNIEFLTDMIDYKEFLLAHDFNSYAIYENLFLQNASYFEGSFSTPSGGAEVFLYDNSTGQILGTCHVPTTGSLSEFVSCRCPLPYLSGTYSIRLQFTKTTSMKSFHFI